MARKRKQSEQVEERANKQTAEEKERKMRYQKSDKQFILRNQKIKPYFRSNSSLEEQQLTITESNDTRKVASSALAVRPNEFRMIYLQFYL